MNYYEILSHFYPNMNYFCIDTYETLEWYETDKPKPSKESLASLYETVKDKWELELIREKRNQLLKESDYTALPDFPNREMWLVYRLALRDFPSNFTSGMDFPLPPK